MKSELQTWIFYSTPLVFQENNNVQIKACVWEKNPESAKQANFVGRDGGRNLLHVMAFNAGDLSYEFFLLL